MCNGLRALGTTLEQDLARIVRPLPDGLTNNAMYSSERARIFSYTTRVPPVDRGDLRTGGQ